MAASGQTRLQIINAVLPRLRESTVATSSSTTYANLVAAVLNSVKTQIEQAWLWKALRDTYTVTVVPGTTAYVLTSSGLYSRIIDVWNTTSDREVTPGTFGDFNKRFFANDTVATGDVREYSLAGYDVNFDMQIDTWPDVTSTNSLRVNVYKLQPDPTADNTVILVPNQILIEGIIAYLMAERGDDNGIAVETQMNLYKDMLAGAISNEAAHDSSETDWTPI